MRVLHVLWAFVSLLSGAAAFMGGYLLGAYRTRRSIYKAIRELEPGDVPGPPPPGLH